MYLGSCKYSLQTYYIYIGKFLIYVYIVLWRSFYDKKIINNDLALLVDITVDCM